MSSNNIGTIRAGALAGVGIGLFTRPSLSGELWHPDITAVRDDSLNEVKDVSLVWPKHRYVSAPVRMVTDFIRHAGLPCSGNHRSENALGPNRA
ncbi:hypothetical protein K8353_05145 [Burkholderia contaminans]|nr:hypothetical protein [Burkholderia contaminans]